MPREGHDGLMGVPIPAIVVFQSTCPARGTTVEGRAEQVAVLISIHVPREGHDGKGLDKSMPATLFQSTCPARGTTQIIEP